MTGDDLFGGPAPPAALPIGRKSAMVGESGYERAEHNFYETREPWITRLLLKKYPIKGPVWECACGRLAMSNVLAERFEVISSDIADHGIEGEAWVQLDFLKAREALTNARGEPAHAIITNPPYDENTARFARKALELTQPHGGQVALLLRNEWDSAKNRADLFDLMPFALKLVLRKRPRWSDDDKASPRHNFAWFIWDWRAEQLRRIAWGG